MKKILLVAAISMFLLGWGAWLVLDGRTGWTTTQTPIVLVDDITGIEYTEYREELRLGIEVPGAATIAAVGIALASLGFKRRKPI
jgi:hypothetical protein